GKASDRAAGGGSLGGGRGGGGGAGGGGGPGGERGGSAARGLAPASARDTPGAEGAEGAGGVAGCGDAGRAVPGNASAAGGGGGSCDTSGTPSMGTDLVSRHGSPRRIPSVPVGRDALGMIASRDSTSCDDATGGDEGGSGVSGDARVTRIRSTPAAARRLGMSSVPGWSASALKSWNSCGGGGAAGNAISPMPWRSSRCTRPVRPSPSHGMPLISRRPPAARRLTAASFSKPSSARNSAFWSSRAPGSRNRVTQRANRAASVSCVDIGSVNLGGTPTPGNAAGFREHHATDRYTGMPATGPIVRALRAAHLHDAPRADLLRLACEKIRGGGRAGGPALRPPTPRSGLPRSPRAARGGSTVRRRRRDRAARRTAPTRRWWRTAIPPE